MNGASTSECGQSLGSVKRTIRYKDLCRSARLKSFGGLFTSFTRPDNHDLAPFQVSKDLFCQVYRYGTDRDTAASDRGGRAGLFTYLKRFLKKSIQKPAHRACTARMLVSALELTKNFRFSDHHRFQTRGHAK